MSAVQQAVQQFEVWAGDPQIGLWSLDEAPPSVEWTEEEIEKLRFLVMEDAARAFVDGRTGRSSFDEAADWVDDDLIAPFSFRVCCASLGVDPDVLRNHLHDLAVRRKFRGRRGIRRRRGTHGPDLFNLEEVGNAAGLAAIGGQ